MLELFNTLATVGATALHLYWLPVLAWTACAWVLTVLATKRAGDRQPEFQHSAAIVLLLALPLGVAAGLAGAGQIRSAPFEAHRTAQLSEQDSYGSGVSDFTSTEGDFVDPAVEQAPGETNYVGRAFDDAPQDEGPTTRAGGRASASHTPGPALAAKPAASRQSSDLAHRGSARLDEPMPAQFGRQTPNALTTQSSPSPRDEGVLFFYAVVGLISIAIVCWITALLVGLIGQLFLMHQYRTSLQPMDGPGIRRVLDAQLRHADIRRKIAIVRGPSGVPPMTFGWWKPVIVIPADLGEGADFAAALAHEVQHVRRFDYPVAVVVRIATLPFAWHPLVVHLSKKVRDARELLCDRGVLEKGDVALHQYAELLVRFARSKPDTGRLQPALAVSTSQLKRRIEEMYTPDEPHGIPARGRIIAAAAMLLVSLVATACMGPANDAPGTAMNDDVSYVDLPSLELQVNYLVQELQNIRDEKSQIREADSTADMGDVVRSIKWRVASQREALLNEILGEKLRERELARMEAAVGLSSKG